MTTLAVLDEFFDTPKPPPADAVNESSSWHHAAAIGDPPSSAIGEE